MPSSYAGPNPQLRTPIVIVFLLACILAAAAAQPQEDAWQWIEWLLRDQYVDEVSLNVLNYSIILPLEQNLCGAVGSPSGLAEGAKAFCESRLREGLIAHDLSPSHLAFVPTIRIFILWIALLSRARPQ